MFGAIGGNFSHGKLKSNSWNSVFWGEKAIRFFFHFLPSPNLPVVLTVQIQSLIAVPIVLPEHLRQLRNIALQRTVDVHANLINAQLAVSVQIILLQKGEVGNWHSTQMCCMSFVRPLACKVKFDAFSIAAFR